LRWWPELSDAQREGLLGQIESIPWDALDPVISTLVRERPKPVRLTGLQPAPVFPRQPPPEQRLMYEDAVRRGREMLSAGKVAAFTVAGGQGTRLGFDGPKGMLPVTPVGNRTLFDLYAAMVLAARRKYGADIAWYIMTSLANHEATLAYFRSHGFFGLPSQDVMFFTQGMLPAFDFQGRALLADKDSPALSPDGHGGSLKALVHSGAVDDMKRRGISTISYFQVDNPLVKPFDPLFIGLHGRTGSEMSTKVAPKADDLERVGNVCLHQGKVTVVEYFEFPEEYARARDSQGRRLFDAGNLAIHVIEVGFVERIAGQTFQLPFRRAEKIVPYVDEAGRIRRPDKPNAVKLETFIFDVLPLARNPLMLEVERAEEFSPVKNASGVDSVETAHRDQVARACRWLESAGVAVPRQPDGRPDVTVCISPLLALDADDLVGRAGRIPTLKPGETRYLEELDASQRPS
jgi:UDP-N-acetylglucosamine/UDP-N-acetylgalactosamine diphosphorylase